MDVKEVVSKISEIYKVAQKNNFFPILPAGEYSCIQLVLNPELDLEKRVREIWEDREDSRIIVENIVLDKYSFVTRPSELQKLERVLP